MYLPTRSPIFETSLFALFGAISPQRVANAGKVDPIDLLVFGRDVHHVQRCTRGYRKFKSMGKCHLTGLRKIGGMDKAVKIKRGLI